ncbi:protein FAM83D-like [Acipenser oxyrinchus oxyrinchus]|uniref:Protein FAM83D-like n=1 Tax=Acipenser oxyrinchus oxyrinchus TaxID=40147 RepID=A0AAD8CS25_ACIOX|nr:protein FAM83D-like [Acipenser oxyrinchus oxyrinchus]
MALSQCLDDFPVPVHRMYQFKNDFNPQELYNETHRLALEELISGGRDGFLEFLKKEKIPNFLSDDEIRRIVHSADVPKWVSLAGDEGGLEQSITSSLDCSSVTYFPEVSDIEPPHLEIGWPAFTGNSYRGVTRAVAHFQPSYGECIYSCKEAARRMIKSAKEVIALVTDSLTDLDIFKDLQEACTKRRVPVYILLDQSCLPSFLQMCKSLNVRLDELQQMRVRTITGVTYFTRSGVKIVGKVHERFMLIDGNRVATGSYRFTWTDGRLNSSNLLELSGQVSEHFDEEFRILYAQSKPLNPKAPASCRNSGVYDHLATKLPAARELPLGNLLGVEPCRLSSTPNRAKPAIVPPGGEDSERPKNSRVSEASTIGEEPPKMEDWLQEPDPVEGGHPADTLTEAAIGAPGRTQTEKAAEEPTTTCHAFTQTNVLTVDCDAQTDVLSMESTQSSVMSSTASSTQTNSQESSAAPVPSAQVSPPHVIDALKCSPPKNPDSSQSPDGSLRICFQKLSKERQYHYSTIRAKLDHMVSLLSHRRELVGLTFNPRCYNRRKMQEHNPHALRFRDGALMPCLTVPNRLK